MPVICLSLFLPGIATFSRETRNHHGCCSKVSSRLSSSLKLPFDVAADDWRHLLGIGNQIILVCESRTEKCRPAIAC